MASERSKEEKPRHTKKGPTLFPPFWVMVLVWLHSLVHFLGSIWRHVRSASACIPHFFPPPPPRGFAALAVNGGVAVRLLFYLSQQLIGGVS